MALSLKDRVKESTTTLGTGTLTLVSAPSGFRRFGSVLSDGDTTYYCIESGTQWEVGIGTYSANTLARTTVLASSNANALINITASRSFVFITYAADKAVYKDGSSRAVIGAAGLIFSDNTVQTTAATTPDLSPYVPYTGATSGLNLGAYALTCGAITASSTTIATGLTIDAGGWSGQARIVMSQSRPSMVGYISYVNAAGIGHHSWSGHLVPCSSGGLNSYDNSMDLGEVSNRWRHLYAGGYLHLSGDSSGTAGKIYLGSVTPSSTNYAIGGYNGNTWINAPVASGYVHLGANDEWGVAVTGSAYSLPSQVGMRHVFKLGWSSSTGNPVAPLDAYFVRNSASSIGVKGASGIDGALTTGAITASDYIYGTSAQFSALGAFGGYGVGSATLAVQALNSSTIGMNIRGQSGQAADLLKCKTSANTDVFTVGPTGAIIASGLVTASVGVNIGTGYNLQIGPNVYVSRGSGSTLDLNADAGVRVRNYANSADAALSCGDVTSSGTISGNMTIGSNTLYMSTSGYIRFADFADMRSGGGWGLVDVAPMDNNRAGTVRVYNDIHSLTNYERLEIGQGVAGDAFIRTAAGGTGTRRNLTLDAGTITASGNLSAASRLTFTVNETTTWPTTGAGIGYRYNLPTIWNAAALANLSSTGVFNVGGSTAGTCGYLLDGDAGIFHEGTNSLRIAATDGGTPGSLVVGAITASAVPSSGVPVLSAKSTADTTSATVEFYSHINNPIFTLKQHPSTAASGILTNVSQINGLNVISVSSGGAFGSTTEAISINSGNMRLGYDGGTMKGYVGTALAAGLSFYTNSVERLSISDAGSITASGVITSTVSAANGFYAANAYVQARAFRSYSCDIDYNEFGLYFTTATSGMVRWQNSVAVSSPSSGVLEINNGTAGTLRDLSCRAITASGNVGIRTSPVSPLHVKESANNYTGGITLENTNGWYSYLWNGTGGLVIDSGPSLPEIYLQTLSTTRAVVSSAGLSVTGVITASGNVGIGGASLTAPLNIQAASSGALGIDIYGRVSNNASLINFYTNAGASQSFISSDSVNGLSVAQVSNLAMHFYTNNVERLTIAAGGDITATGQINASSVRCQGGNGIVGTRYLNNSNDTWSAFEFPASVTGAVFSPGVAGILRFEGSTSSHPAIKRSSTTIAFRLADDSADAALVCAGITASDSVTTNGLFSSDRYAVSANYRFRRANGTSSSPTQVTSGQAVGALSSFGYHDSGAFHSSAGALVYFVAAENFTSTAQGTNIQFWTTPTTSTTSAKRLCIEASGELTLEAGSHIQTSGAGIKIGTATSQKIGFWNATPVVQQTTASTSATVAGGGGTTVTQTDTFDGYTLAQIVKALRTIGILA